MSIISEEEAKKHPDLYQFETWCIDLLKGIKILRQQGRQQQGIERDIAFIRNSAVESGHQMETKLPALLREIEAQSE